MVIVMALILSLGMNRPHVGSHSPNITSYPRGGVESGVAGPGGRESGASCHGLEDADY